MNKADAADKPSPSPPAFAALRRDIDALDERILDLLAERFVLAQSFGKDKPLEGSVGKSALSTAALPALRPQREHHILSRLIARCREKGLPEALIVQLWRQLMSATAFVQIPYAVSYLQDDALCLVALGACFSPYITLLPQATQGEVIAVLSQESNAFALVSLSTPHPPPPPSVDENSIPWWRYLFSTHAPRILQALPSLALPDKNTTQRVLLLGRLPSFFLDEEAAYKFFLVNLQDAQADKNLSELELELHNLETPTDAKSSLKPSLNLSLLGRHEKTILLCYSEASRTTGAVLVEALSAWGEARHIGSTHDDWTARQAPRQSSRQSPLCKIVAVKSS